jgi:poly-gamma-glutamate capsule biosynthesis protein CapA/YwtB (metallophosphatase superfamily)
VTSAPMTLFLAGDVMTGRGIDQALPVSVDPELFEPWVHDARRYVELAERANGPIDAPLAPREPWGEALPALRLARPDVRIVNLETSITTHDRPWLGKGIHYRMHPGNVGVLTAAGIGVCVLANNHVLDYGRPGLRETMTVLDEAGIRYAGAGRDAEEASAPAEVETGHGRLLVFAYVLRDAGAPSAWRAGMDRCGVAYLPDDSLASAEKVVANVLAHRRPADRVVVSLHWGRNWGYDVPPSQRAFAHLLVTSGAADLVFGHSSHHPKGIEVIDGRGVLYGAGDLLNDYEGIAGHEEVRPDLVLMYFPTLGASGELSALELVPMRLRRFRLQRATAEEAHWLAWTLERVSSDFGTRVEVGEEGRLAVRW